MSQIPSHVREAVAAAYRTEWSRVVGAVVRVSRDFAVAEDCVQDAFGQALVRWPLDGVPQRPGAWLTTVAVRQALQVHRRAATLGRKLPLLVPDDEYLDLATVFDQLPDDRLRLVFTCCHPALSQEARIALTLRMVCGLTSGQVASAFLVEEATMQARITRAKKKIAEAGIPYRTPTGDDLPERIASVLDTVHLVFTVGHVATAGEELLQADLADRGLDLARMLHELMPEDSETTALLAFLVLTDARRAARTDADGALVLLADQDRSQWNREELDEGLSLLRDSLREGRAGRYAVTAAIAGVHSRAACWADTDWPQIVSLYDVLLHLWPSPVVALNRAAAVGEAHGPAAGLAATDGLIDDPALATYHYLPAARADLLRRLGRPAEAAAAYREAITLTGNGVEAAYLRGRLEQLGEKD